LLGQVVENVRGSKVDEIVLVQGHAAETIKERIAIQSLKVVINETYRQGMGTSLRAGLAALPPEVDAALIVLADQPFVCPATLNYLMEQYRQSSAPICGMMVEVNAAKYKSEFHGNSFYFCCAGCKQ
jgi:molybdenum cofactor cytidylyltransferase